VVGSVRRWAGLGLEPCLTLVAPDGCAGQSSRDYGLCAAQPQVNLAVRLRVVKPTVARPGSQVNRQTRPGSPAQVAVKRTAGRRGFLVGWPGRCPPRGPPNLSSSRPPELAVANVTGQRPAAAEHRR
jgi:hypothetical protein